METAIISEFYQLRRTAIKDLAAYIGFLAGFIGGAPFAWGLLSDQLASGSFVKGLWYFFAIVIAAGIFTGSAGLGLGIAAGIVWEQLHRRHRRENLKAKRSPGDNPERVSTRAATTPSPLQPRLQLVSVGSPQLPMIDGRVLRSVQFRSESIELDFGGIRLDVRGNPVAACGGQRSRFPDAGSRDALCSLIGARVQGMRSPSADRIEVVFDSGCELVMLRSSVAVA